MGDDNAELVRAMRAAAGKASREAAGRVIGDRVGAEHPELPPLVWSAGDERGDPTWNTTGYVSTGYDDAETCRIVGMYASALDGSDPQVRDLESGWHLETVATFAGIEVTIWGVLSDSKEPADG